MKTQITIDTIFAVLFFALFVVALVGIFRGAWWHIGMEGGGTQPSEPAETDWDAPVEPLPGYEPPM